MIRISPTTASTHRRQKTRISPPHHPRRLWSLFVVFLQSNRCFPKSQFSAPKPRGPIAPGGAGEAVLEEHANDRLRCSTSSKILLMPPFLGTLPATVAAEVLNMMDKRSTIDTVIQLANACEWRNLSHRIYVSGSTSFYFWANAAGDPHVYFYTRRTLMYICFHSQQAL